MPLNPQVKRRLLEMYERRVCVEGEKRTILDAVWRLALSVAGAFEGRGEPLVLPAYEGL